MAIKLITGVPGSGKTNMAVKMILEYINEGKTVYSDISGLQIDGVNQPPDDYRQLPPKSVVFYDEVQKRKVYSRKFKGYDEIIESLQTHRHEGYDLVLMTQHPKFLNTDVLVCVTEHHHLHRPMGMKFANVWMWRVAQENPNTKSSKKDCENQYIYTYRKELFSIYRSTVEDTHSKIKIPEKVISAAWMLLVIVAILFYSMHKLSQSNNAESADSEMVATETKSDTQSMISVSRTEPATTSNTDFERNRVASVFSSGTSCRAYNSFGDMLSISQAQCMQYSYNPATMQSGDQTIKSERLQAINYQSGQQSSFDVAKLTN